MGYDWSKFNKKITINAPVEAVYLAWTIPDILEKWFLRTAMYHFSGDKLRAKHDSIMAGDEYEWLWHGYNDEVRETGKVLQANGMDKLQFTFGKAGVVTVDIGKVVNETVIMLTQEQIPTDEYAKLNYHIGCQNGWTFYMTNLKSYLEGGIDLRNKNVTLKGVLNS